MRIPALSRRCLCIAVGFSTLAAATVLTANEPAEPLTFERDVRPILKAHCLDCHGAEAEPKGGLDLRLARFMLSGGDSGAAIVAGQPAGSLLIERVESGEMPPGEKKMSAAELSTIRRWIEQGAKTARPEPEKLDPGIGITPEEREFWSFQPIARPAVPDVKDDAVRTPIDSFIAARLEQRGLTLSADAERLTLLRRAYFDLTGLPPTRDEVAAFLADESDDAYERLVERLLESPHCGERWGRHWLDAAGYADSEGYTNNDALRPWAYKYRDWVVRALNADMPFDQFIVWQLAGDELVPPPHTNLSAEQIDMLTATGFLRMAADGTGSGANDDVARNQTIADTIKIVSTSLMGLSVGCAQCHDHRYDPIPQSDYYRLRAVLAPALDWKAWKPPQQRLVSLYTDADRAAAAEAEAAAAKIAEEKNAKQTEYLAAALEQELAKFDETLREKLRAAYKTPDAERTDEQKQLLKEHPSVNISPGVLYQYNQAAADDLKKYDERIATERAKKPVEEFVRALAEPPGHAPVTHLFYRGEFNQPLDAVEPGDLTIAAPPGERFTTVANDESLPTTGRRLAFARHLVDGNHPLVARVIVNRVWMNHFGRGLVGTPADFGVLGERPTHPELLDWLAAEFMADGWSLKRLHRRIMLSTVYRQTSAFDPEKAAVDGANLLYWRKPIVRLDAEAIRDRVLAAAGSLDDSMFGPPVAMKPDDTGQIVEEGEPRRRSIYLQVRRSQPHAMLTSFDAPVMETNCDRRRNSTVATQSLLMLNSQMLADQAAKFAGRVRNDAAGNATPLPPAPADKSDWNFANEVGRSRPAWHYGYGEFSESEQRLTAFTPLPHFTGSAWQGSAALPDPSLGWVTINANGGHPGDAAHSPIRRWIAPAAGRLTIEGQLSHPSESGDGVRGRVVVGGDAMRGEWLVHHGSAATAVATFDVESDQTVDFVIDCRESVTSDSFHWTVKLSLETPAGGAPSVWESAGGFQGPLALSTPPPLPPQIALAWQLAYHRPITTEEMQTAIDFVTVQSHRLSASPNQVKQADVQWQAMAHLCQMLLASNEFLYVD